jgi:endogenous inhibitor of DNA gyrase (YacG/DUF329 family)
MTRRCPHCRKLLPQESGPYRPFCSWRCKLMDLGAWLDGSYRLPGPAEELAEGNDEPRAEDGPPKRDS